MVRLRNAAGGRVLWKVGTRESASRHRGQFASCHMFGPRAILQRRRVSEVCLETIDAAVVNVLQPAQKLSRDDLNFVVAGTIVSLLQPPPETVALFDEVILLDRGRVIFAGPIDEVVGHFTALGYKVPPRMDPADWLQTLPTPDGANFLVDDKQKHLTNEEFVEKFAQSERGQLLAERLKAPLSESIEPIKGEKEFTKQFHNTWWKSTQLVFQREALLWWRDKYQLKAR